MSEITEAVEALTALVGEPAAHWSISGEPGDECVDVQVADLRALLSELTRLQEEVKGLRGALEEARDLLLERTHGSPARSASHNARLCIESALATLQGQQS